MEVVLELFQCVAVAGYAVLALEVGILLRQAQEIVKVGLELLTGAGVEVLAPGG